MVVSNFKKIMAIFPVLLFLSCESGPSDVLNIDPSSLLDPPRGIQASVGDRTVTLSWVHDSPDLVESFRIFRSDSADSVIRAIGTTSDGPCLDG